MKIEPVGSFAHKSRMMLRMHRVLGGAADAEFKLILARSNHVTIAEHELLFTQGDVGHAVVFVLTGFIKLVSNTRNGREVILEICGPGSLFGELAILNQWPRSADAIAMSDCAVVSVPGAIFRDILIRSPEVMFALVEVLSRRLVRATEHICDAASLPGPARLAKALTQLAAAYGRVDGDVIHLDVTLSQRELGALTGLTRESINKQLAAWRDTGWIEISSRHITLLAGESLRCVANGTLP